MTEGGSDNKTRKMIYNYISSHQGASFGDIKKVLDINKSTLTYHLIYLERTDKIHSKKEGKRRCYYPKHRTVSEMYPSPKSNMDSLTKIQKNLINIIQNRSGITKDEIIKKTRLNIHSAPNLKKISIYKIKLLQFNFE